ncbi:Quercetin 2,3-dioxygenase [compost metagenome]
MVSSKADDGALPIGQDMTIFLSRLDAGVELVHQSAADRKLFLYVIEGSLNAGGTALGADDVAEIQRQEAFVLSAVSETFFMLIDMP